LRGKPRPGDLLAEQPLGKVDELCAIKNDLFAEGGEDGMTGTIYLTMKTRSPSPMNLFAHFYRKKLHNPVEPEKLKIPANQDRKVVA